MKFTITTIPHKKQRYCTTGDWQIDKAKGAIDITVSRLYNKHYEFLIGVHELVESYLCQVNGITQKSVDDFDIKYEKDREKRIHSMTSEPGDDPKAPYRNEHSIATAVERIICGYLNISWKEYEDCCNNVK